MGNRYFTPKLFAFLRDLAENNNRDWFLAHKEDYERHVREPALDFISDLAAPLAQISEHIVADSRKVGGSLFRIQRDMRFSPDGAPYKTNTGIHLRHFLARDVHAPGLYLNIEPRACFMGAGIWRPDAATARAVRVAIVESTEAWDKAVAALPEGFTFEGDSLKRPPRGFDSEHRRVEDLMRKDFTAGTALTQAVVTSDDFLDHFIARCRGAAPFMEFLCRAIDVPF